MAMLTNGPPAPKLPKGPECSFPGGPHYGRIHEFTVQMVAEIDGTPVKDAPKEKTYVCLGHAPPDPADPGYLQCTCRLCRVRKGEF